jgi:hypothetical protein
VSWDADRGSRNQINQHCTVVSRLCVMNIRISDDLLFFTNTFYSYIIALVSYFKLQSGIVYEGVDGRTR